MTEAIERPVSPSADRPDHPVLPTAPTRPGAPDQGGWALLLVPTTICLVMFVVAFWW